MFIAKKTCTLAEQAIHDVNAGVDLAVEALANGEFKLVVEAPWMPGGRRSYTFDANGKFRTVRSSYEGFRLKRSA